MKGYVIIDTEVIDAEAYAEYVEKVLPVFAAHGGRFLVRTGDAEPVQGDWAPKRFVIAEFDSLEAARGFANSDEYWALNEIRQRASNSRAIVVQGFDPGG